MHNITLEIINTTIDNFKILLLPLVEDQTAWLVVKHGFLPLAGIVIKISLTLVSMMGALAVVGLPVLCVARAHRRFRIWHRDMRFEAEMRRFRNKEGALAVRMLHESETNETNVEDTIMEEELVPLRADRPNKDLYVPKARIGRFVKKLVRELYAELGELDHTPANEIVGQKTAAKIMLAHNIRKADVGVFMSRAAAWYFIPTKLQLASMQLHLSDPVAPLKKQKRGLGSTVWDRLFGGAELGRYERAD